MARNQGNHQTIWTNERLACWCVNAFPSKFSWWPQNTFLSKASIRNCLNCVHNCDVHGLLDFKSAVQYMKHFISHPFKTHFCYNIARNHAASNNFTTRGNLRALYTVMLSSAWKVHIQLLWFQLSRVLRLHVHVNLIQIPFSSSRAKFLSQTCITHLIFCSTATHYLFYFLQESYFC